VPKHRSGVLHPSTSASRRRDERTSVSRSRSSNEAGARRSVITSRSGRSPASRLYSPGSWSIGLTRKPIWPQCALSRSMRRPSAGSRSSVNHQSLWSRGCRCAVSDTPSTRWMPPSTKSAARSIYRAVSRCPRFALEGIVSRFQAVKVEGRETPATFIETSSPGLRGQSGGPLLDVAGRVCGVQSHTAHLDLGFDASYQRDGERVVERQFLNIGRASHVDGVLAFLDEHGVSHQTG
jgi:hypothetical protein